jgi:hypothetical protein
MRTPDGAWRVEVIRTHGGEVARVRSWAGHRRERRTGLGSDRRDPQHVAEVMELLGDAFADLVDV